MNINKNIVRGEKCTIHSEYIYCVKASHGKSYARMKKNFVTKKSRTRHTEICCPVWSELYMECKILFRYGPKKNINVCVNHFNLQFFNLMY